MNSAYSAKHAIPEGRLEFEKFLVGLSAKFVALPPEQVDDQIRSAFKEVLKFFQIDRCNLFRLLPGKTSFQVTHNADVNGISPYPIETPPPVSLFPWASQKLQQREILSFARLEELPAEAAADKQAFVKFGVRCGLYIPISALRSTEYSLGISSAKED